MSKTDTFLNFLPYCLRRQDDGTWLILNRRYKTLDWVGRTWQSEYPETGTRFKADLSEALDFKTNERTSDTVWLWDSRSDPLGNAHQVREYHRRIEVLESLSENSVE